MKYSIYIFFILLIFHGCSVKPLAPITLPVTEHNISYLQDIKPILDNKCVSCHSCYNAPCQLKLNSYEGLTRGGSKIGVYDTRLRAIEPTRLFMDATSTHEWRTKEFFDVMQNDSNTTHNNSTFLQMLEMKSKYPKVVGEYRPETEEWSCPRDKKEIAVYFDKKGNHRGMPYGLPPLNQKEYETIKKWLYQGAAGPSVEEEKALKTPSIIAQKEIEKWEAFFNNPEPKYKMTARYLYEHLYLAHIYFKGTKDEYFELVRSKTPSGKPIDIIATTRVYDNPNQKEFYYRLRKVHETIVHKTHMTMLFDDEKLQRLTKQFIQTPWMEKPYIASYDEKRSANPFLTYAQIPPKIRYQFLLDNAHFTVMTFIRGPVCRGQVALASIRDYFWVFFQDPSKDISLIRPSFLLEESSNLAMPIEGGSEYKLYKLFSDEYLDRYKKYFDKKAHLYNEIFPHGNTIEGIYKGENQSDTPMLTVYRHFDSASVHKGALGELPSTAWVIDYPLFERIYYTLVAGYDVFGNVSHQLNVRRFMDFLRYEGELNFISYMPSNKQLTMFKSWSKGDDSVQNLEKLWHHDTKIDFKTNNPYREFIEDIVDNHLHKDVDISFDDVNYYKTHHTIPSIPKKFTKLEDYKNGFRALTQAGTGFIKHVTDSEINTLLLRIKLHHKKDIVVSIIVNRYHDNVSSLIRPDNTLDSSKDTLDFHVGFVGSYPNGMMVVDIDDMPDFFNIMNKFDFDENSMKHFKKFFIGREHPEFWEHFAWFQKRFYEEDPINAGLLDLIDTTILSGSIYCILKFILKVNYD